MKEMLKNSTMLFLMIALVYLGGVGVAQIVNDKQTTDWTGSTQGEKDTIYDMIMNISATVDTLSQICDRVIWKLDELERHRENDSIDDAMRYWYEVLDTNSNGDIDDTENRDTIWE